MVAAKQWANIEWSLISKLRWKWISIRIGFWTAHPKSQIANLKSQILPHPIISIKGNQKRDTHLAAPFAEDRIKMVYDFIRLYTHIYIYIWVLYMTPGPPPHRSIGEMSNQKGEGQVGGQTRCRLT